MTRPLAALLFCACAPAPQPAPVVDEPMPPLAFALLAEHTDDAGRVAVPIACVTVAGTIEDGATCAPRLLGEQATLGSGLTVLGEVRTVTCASTGASAIALAAPPAEGTGTGAAWGFAGRGLPSGWHIAQNGTVDQATFDLVHHEVVAGNGGNVPSEDAPRTEVSERLDLNGTRVLRAHVEEEAPGDPGHSQLFLVGNDILALPSDGLHLDGAVTSPGAFPMGNGAYLLVLTSRTPSGVGVHAVDLGLATLAAAGEWVCAPP